MKKLLLVFLLSWILLNFTSLSNSFKAIVTVLFSIGCEVAFGFFQHKASILNIIRRFLTKKINNNISSLKKQMLP